MKDNRKNRKSSQTFLSGEFVKESDDEGDLFMNDSKIDIEGNLGATGDKNPGPEIQENHLEIEKEFNPPLLQNKKEDFIKEKNANVFNSVEYDPEIRSNSNKFCLNITYFMNNIERFIEF